MKTLTAKDHKRAAKTNKDKESKTCSHFERTVNYLFTQIVSPGTIFAMKNAQEETVVEVKKSQT